MASKKKNKLDTLPSMAGYEGLCSRFTDLVGMKRMLPSASWEMHIVDRTMTILQFRRPELLEQIRTAIKEEYETNGKRMPEDVSENGNTTRCPTCRKAW